MKSAFSARASSAKNPKCKKRVKTLKPRLEKVPDGLSIPDRLPSESRSPRAPHERHVVLVAPEVHWNTGNIGRTCIAVDAHLHLIKPLGFSLDSREVKRAGLDYWHQVTLSIWESMTDFMQTMAPDPSELAVMTKKASRSFREIPSQRRLFLIFGSETKGLPATVLSRFSEALFHIPTTRAVRSLNLSTAVGIVLYETLRWCDPPHGW